MTSLIESPGSEPFTLGPPRGKQNGKRALLLHGLTGSPWDLRLLAQSFAAQGFRAHVPLLAGHLSLDALEHSQWQDWYQNTRRILFQEFTPQCPGILLGFSMGGLLALELAAQHPERIRGLVLISVPLSTSRIQLRAARLLARLRERPLLRSLIGMHQKSRIDVRIQAVAEQSPGFQAFPYRALSELLALQTQVLAHRSQVHAPTLILHGRFDHAAALHDSLLLSQSLGSASVRRVVMPRSYHLIPRDVDRARACLEIHSFVQSLPPVL